MYVYITNTDKENDLLQYRPVLPSFRQGRRPVKNNTETALTTAKIWLWVPERINAKTDWQTDWLTDRPTLSCKVTLTLTDYEFIDKYLQRSNMVVNFDVCIFSTKGWGCE
jgi:hypothetical protein